MFPDDETPDDWQMSAKRREKVNKAIDDLKEVVNRDPPPSFYAVEESLANLTRQHETNKNK